MKKIFTIVVFSVLCVTQSVLAQDFYLCMETTEKASDFEVNTLQKITLEDGKFVVYRKDGSVAASVSKADVNSMKFSETPVGISNVENVENVGNVENYNLAGQKVGDDYKGIVIRKGKKELRR